jgi:4-amino-4-deoxy-L-arabinose transferase-like glycosyltransferase
MSSPRDRLASIVARVSSALRDPKPAWPLLFVLFLLALWPRLDFVDEHPPGLYLVSDMAIYRERTLRLLDGPSDIWDTFTPPGYPALIALLFAAFGREDRFVGWLHALLGAATVVLAFLAARRLSGSAVAALAAFAVLAVYPPLLLYTGLFLTETAFAFFLLLFFTLFVAAAESGRKLVGALAGIVFGVAAAVRPNLLLAVPFLAVVAFILRSDRRVLRAAAIAAIAAAPVLVGASIRPSRLAGRPVLLATNGGVNFYLAHTDARALRFPAGDAVREISTYTSRARSAPVEEVTLHAHDDAAFYARGLTVVRRAPLAAVGRALRAIGDGLGLGRVGGRENPAYWPGWLGHDDALAAWLRAMLALGTAPAIAHAARLAWRRKLRASDELPRLVALALFASAIATLALFLGNPRVRLPFDPLVIALAASAWTALARALRRSPDDGAPRAAPPGSGSDR